MNRLTLLETSNARSPKPSPDMFGHEPGAMSGCPRVARMDATGTRSPSWRRTFDRARFREWRPNTDPEQPCRHRASDRNRWREVSSERRKGCRDRDRRSRRARLVPQVARPALIRPYFTDGRRCGPLPTPWVWAGASIAIKSIWRVMPVRNHVRGQLVPVARGVTREKSHCLCILCTSRIDAG
jgi:hypothetical protein